MEMLETQTMGKVARRLIPYLMFCYFFCFLDRVNVGFAALQMNKDLGFRSDKNGHGRKMIEGFVRGSGRGRERPRRRV